MLKIALVVFREGTEIALTLAIIMAVTKQVKKSRLSIIAGIVLGIVAALLFGYFVRSVSSLFDGVDDQVFDLTVMLLTIIMISWTITWMKNYDDKVQQDINDLSTKIYHDSPDYLGLILLVAAVMFREGVEIILMIYGTTVSEVITVNHYLLGFSLGGASGLIFGTIIYWGLAKFAGRYIFKISSVGLALVAAGLAVEAASILTSSGLVTTGSSQIWDSSWLVEDDSTSGIVLKALVGYCARPNQLQLASYLATLCLISTLWLVGSKHKR